MHVNHFTKKLLINTGGHMLNTVILITTASKLKLSYNNVVSMSMCITTF